MKFSVLVFTYKVKVTNNLLDEPDALVAKEANTHNELERLHFPYVLSTFKASLGFQLYIDRCLKVKHYFLLSSPVETRCALGG